MSKHLAELCTLLVDEAFGHLPSRLYSLLVNYGRQPLPLLVQRSRLHPRYVKAGLAVLVQHHLVLYHLIADEDNVPVYEANARNAYDLIRYGKYGHWLKNIIGDDTNDLPETLLVHGSVPAPELAQRYLENSKDDHHKPEANGNTKPSINGHCNGHSPEAASSDRETPPTVTSRQPTQSVESLFSHGYVVESRQVDFMPPYDLDATLETHLLNTKYGHGVKGKDAKIDFANDVRKARRVLLDKNRISFDELRSEERRKRRFEETDHEDHSKPRPQKHRKLNRGNGYEDKPSNVGVAVDTTTLEVEDEDLDDEKAVRVNQVKLDVALRNDKLVSLSARCLGQVPAKVYHALLKCIERKVKFCFDMHSARGEEDVDDDDEEDVQDTARHLKDSADVSPSVTTTEIEAELGPDVDLSGFLDYNDTKAAKIDIGVDAEESVAPKQKKNGFRHKTDELEVDAGSVHSRRLAQVKKVLNILSKHPQRFVYRTAVDRETAWRVDFPSLSAGLIQVELENYVNTRWGSIGVRILRFLHARGRIEEKTMANAILLNQKEARAILSGMQEAGIINTQEVPKDTQRQAKATMFLWFFDQHRARRLVLNDIYKTMSRLLQRMRVERTAVSSVLQKAERTDVMENEELLSATEKQTLSSWREKEEKILVELNRLDDTVAIFRDFLPDMTS